MKKMIYMIKLSKINIDPMKIMKI